MEIQQHTPQKLMVLIALIQGSALLILHQAIELDFWPNNQPHWLFAFYSVSLIWPTMLLLSLTPGNLISVLKYTTPFVLISGMLGYYVGSQAIPVEHIRYDSLLFGYVFTMLIATFKVLMYSQQLASGETITYANLFRWSWRNFLTLTLALLFAISFWMILMLWGALFDAIGINFFEALFEQPWFYYPAVAIANGFGVIIFRRMTHIIDTITRLQQALTKFLLVLLILISILFLSALPFTGLDPLWESGGSALILWMQAIMLFFLNSVYQDDPSQRPYRLWIHRFIYIGIALMPIYSAIAFYGLSLRVEQYGWSIDRCWAFMIWFLLALFPLGYWWGIAKKRDDWLLQLSKVNVVIGLITLTMMLLINSPLLDFRKIVTKSQLEHLSNIDDLDVHYFQSHLARPGYDALQAIKEQYRDTNPAIVVQINQSYSNRADSVITSSKEEFLAVLEVLDGTPNDALLDTIYQREAEHSWQLRDLQHLYIRTIDLNQDGQLDYLLAIQKKHMVQLKVYSLENGNWVDRILVQSYSISDTDQQAFIDNFKKGDIITKPTEWLTLEISGNTFQIRQ